MEKSFINIRSRPIRIKFVKETIDIIIIEIDYTYDTNSLNPRNNSLWERNFVI